MQVLSALCFTSVAMAHQHICAKEGEAACGVAEQICCGEGSADDEREKSIVPKAEQRDEIKVLAHLNYRRKQKDVYGQQKRFLGREDTDKASDQERDQHIAHIRADKAVTDEQRDANLNQQKCRKQYSIGFSYVWFHIFTALCIIISHNGEKCHRKKKNADAVHQRFGVFAIS